MKKHAYDLIMGCHGERAAGDGINFLVQKGTHAKLVLSVRPQSPRPWHTFSARNSIDDALEVLAKSHPKKQNAIERENDGC